MRKMSQAEQVNGPAQRESYEGPARTAPLKWRKKVGGREERGSTAEKVRAVPDRP